MTEPCSALQADAPSAQRTRPASDAAALREEGPGAHGGGRLRSVLPGLTAARPAPGHAQAQGTPDALPVTGAAVRNPQAPAPSARGPHRRGSTAGSAAPRWPGRGCTAPRRSTPPGPGTAATSLGGTAGGGRHHGTLAGASPVGLASRDTRHATQGTPDAVPMHSPRHPRFPLTNTGPRPHPQGGLQPRPPPGRCRLQGPTRLQPPAPSHDPPGRPETPAGGTYLAARAGRAPGAAAPSCCSPARSGPSWRWAGPGSAGCRPAPRRSGTRPPAGASWALGDRTDPADPEELPGARRHPRSHFLPADLCANSNA